MLTKQNQVLTREVNQLRSNSLEQAAILRGFIIQFQAIKRKGIINDDDIKTEAELFEKQQAILNSDKKGVKGSVIQP